MFLCVNRFQELEARKTMEEISEIAMLHESDRSPIEMDTAQSLIKFSQESVLEKHTLLKEVHKV